MVEREHYCTYLIARFVSDAGRLFQTTLTAYYDLLRSRLSYTPGFGAIMSSRFENNVHVSTDRPRSMVPSAETHRFTACSFEVNFDVQYRNAAINMSTLLRRIETHVHSTGSRNRSAVEHIVPDAFDRVSRVSVTW